MAEPISDEALAELEAAAVRAVEQGGAGDRFPAADLVTVVARLRAALATIDHYKGWLKDAEAQVDNLDQCLSEMTTKAWDQSHRAEAAEARAVPEGWKVEWGHSICTYPGCEGGELADRRPAHEVTDVFPTITICPRCHGSSQRPGGPAPRLVPLSPTDTPEEA